MWRTIILIVLPVTVAATNGCVKRRSEERGDDDGHYCVCNATYCDAAPDAIQPSDKNRYILITSSKDGLRFELSSDVYGNINSYNASTGKIIVHENKYQKIIGFGGAVTDSASYNIKSLSEGATNNLLRSYFGPGSIEYSMIRTPMGGSDFSWRPYSYAMVENDTSLNNFTLQEEDYAYKIPVIKKAISLTKKNIKLLTTPWSASPWMKTNNNWTNTGSLRTEYKQLWADYFVKYFQAYRLEDLVFWAVSPQNEPSNHNYIDKFFEGMQLTSEEERDWVINHLSPTLRRNGFEYLKIFVGEENRPVLPQWLKTTFDDKRALNIVSGFAAHWYFDNEADPKRLDETKKLFPTKSLIYTEACTGVFTDKHVILGSWERGEKYAGNIIQNLSHWVSSWMDWNIALNLMGGPNWNDNYVDSPIMINSTADEFYKQPMFYALGHFSKYIPPESDRIGTTSENADGIENVAFSTPDNGTVLVILNTNEEKKEILIEDPVKGITKINVPAKSINTMKYW